MKVTVVAICIVAIIRSCFDVAAAVSFPQAARDLQDETLSQVTSLPETRAQMSTCPQCRSADEIQRTGLLRSLFSQLIIWWLNSRVGETRFVNALKSSEIKVDPSTWTDASQQWTTQAQTLRQQDAIDTSTSSSEVLSQYQYLLTDMSASSLEAATTLVNLAGFDQMGETVPLDYFTCRSMTISNFFNRIVIPNIAVLGDAWYLVSLGGTVEESAMNAVSSLVLDLLENSTSPVLDKYANALLASCAGDDESFVQLQETAEALTSDLTEKRNSFFLYSADLILPSIFAETANLLIQRIQDVLRVIIFFPLVWFFALPVLYLVFGASPLQAFLLAAVLILPLLLLFPFAYIFSIVLAILGKFSLGGPIFTVREMALLKQNPFLFSMDDVECQMQKISCQADALAQMFPPPS
jgi:hypothetical protein